MYFIILFAFFQGFTEFLPISSQGHLILINSFSNSEEKILISILDANVLVHFGSICSVILYYRRELFDFLISVKHLPRPDIDSDSRMLINLIFATTPTLLIGFLFSKYFDYNSDQILLLIGITSLVFGCILYFFDKFCLMVKGRKELNFKNSLVIGLFQALALIPGVSRSGAVLTIMRFQGFNRNFCVFFSNLLSIPVIISATIFIVYKNDFYLPNIIGLQSLLLIFFSFIFSLIFIHFFVVWVRNSSLMIFMIYRIIFGSILIYLYYV